MRRFIKVIALSLLTFSMTFSITSCSYFNGSEDAENVTEDATEDVTEDVKTDASDIIKVRKDSITIAGRPMQSFNPLENQDLHTKYILNLIYDDLFFLNSSLQYTSNIVDVVSFSEDGMSITLSIRDGASWHDGSSIVADDIVYSINQLKANQNTLYDSITNTIAYVKKKDSKTVVVTFNKIVNENTFNLCIPIVQERFYKVASSQKDNVKFKTNGSGKYKLDEVIDSRNIKLTIADKYSESASIKEINIRILESFEAEVNAFNADIVDITVMKPDELKNIKNSESARIINIPTNQYEFLALNFKNPLINDVNIRRALAYAVPTDEALQSIYLNASDRTQTNVNPKSYLYNDNVTHYTEDFEKGKQMLAGSGYTSLNHEGFIEKKTENTSITIDFNILVNEENTYRYNLARKYSENLKAIGIKSQIVAVPFEEYQERLNQGSYDIAIAGYLTNKSQNNISLFGEGNILRYSNANIANINQQLVNAKNTDEYSIALTALQTLVNNELPVISICYKNILLISNNDIGGVEITIDNYLGNIDSWIVFE